jgi:hypothetical protein
MTKEFYWFYGILGVLLRRQLVSLYYVAFNTLKLQLIRLNSRFHFLPPEYITSLLKDQIVNYVKINVRCLS